MQVLKTLKRVAAIGTGVAMLGATLTGALALDLKDYPKPFVTDGVYDDSNVFVYGDTAIAADTVAISDITAGLQFLAKTPVVTSGTAVSVTGGKTAKVPLGQGLSNSTYFDRQSDDTDISTLFDGTVSFGSSDYDTSEELQMCDDSGRIYGEPFVATSLMTDDDYKRDVFFEMGKDKIRYAYKFDETINVTKDGPISTTVPLEIDFLGKKMKITAVTATSITATVGDEYTMKEGDSVTVEGKVIKLTTVGTATAAVEVDGVARNLATATTTTVNGIEIYVDSVVVKTNLGESSAFLVIGKEARDTYDDAEAFIGENIDTPDWVWDIRAMTGQGTSGYTDCGGTENLVLRVENDIDFFDDSDKPTGVGQCLELPNKYLSICLDSLSVVDTDYAEYTLEHGEWDIEGANCNTTLDTSPTGREYGLKLSTAVSEGLELKAADYATGFTNGSASSQKTKEVVFVPAARFCIGAVSVEGVDQTAQGIINVFYRPTESGAVMKYWGAVGVNDTTAVLARVNYGNTKDSNAVLQMAESASATLLKLKTLFTADTAGDLNGGSEGLLSNWTLAANVSSHTIGLGATVANEAGELYWAPSGRWDRTDISTKDEDHRMAYGTVVLEPKGNGGSQKVKLLIPNDLVYANVVVKGSSATVTSGSTSYVPTKVSPVNMAASAVTSPTSFNLIVVGGPCANPLAESVFGQTCSGWAYQEGEALVKLVANGEKVAMLVAGTSALDTQRAGKAVANYDKYAFSGAEVLVKGASMTDITVEQPSVAAPVVAAEEVVA